MKSCVFEFGPKSAGGLPFDCVFEAVQAVIPMEIRLATIRKYFAMFKNAP